MKKLLIHEFLEASSESCPDKKAVWDRGRWHSYREIEQRANRAAAFFLAQGLQRGDRVVLLLENSAVFVSLYFAVLKAGGAVVGLHTDTSTDELSYLLQNSEAECLCISEERWRQLGGLRDGDRRRTQRRNSRTHSAAEAVSSLRAVVLVEAESESSPEASSFHTTPATVTFAQIQNEYPDRRPKIRQIDIDLAEIVYTSGSTGSPKGVMLSHLNLASNMRSIVDYLQLTAEDRIMVILPFTYIYGKSLLLTHFLVGGSVVIDNRFAYPNRVLETMAATEVTGFAGVPSTFSYLLSRSSLCSRRFPALRYVTQAGGHMAPTLQREASEAFHPALLYVMYGATEAAPRLSYLEPSLLIEKSGSIGTPVPNVNLLVVDEEGRELPADTEGEIAARGSNIMRGYWKDPEGTAAVLRNGLYFTGDLGFRDADGYFFIVGRKKEIIKVRGFRVSAKEIEERLLEIEQVADAAVVGVADEVTGEAVKAYLVVIPGKELEEQEVLSFLKPRISAHKIPRHIEFRDALPKNSSGKIMKSEL